MKSEEREREKRWIINFTFFQADVEVKELCESCVLLSESGEVIDEKIDKRMQFHFEAMLDINKQLKKEQEKDACLLGKSLKNKLFWNDFHVICSLNLVCFVNL